jgi:AraC-like DNA-binding protein
MRSAPLPSSRPESTISRQYVLGFCDAIDTAPEVISQGLRQFELRVRGENIERVSLRRYCEYIEWLAVELNRPHLGLEVSQCGGPERLGAVGYLFLGSRSLEIALRGFSHYFSEIQDNSKIILKRDGKFASLEYKMDDNRILHRRQDNECSLGHCWRLIQLLSGNSSSLVLVEFEHDRIGNDNRPYERVFNAPVIFGQSSNRLHFRSDDLSICSSLGDQHLANILEHQLEKTAVEDPGVELFSDQVRSIIMSLGLQHGIAAKSIAGTLGISETTLYRRLALEKTSFKSLTDDVRKSLAIRLLVSNSVTIREVAERLGYADSACLTRAFYRWFGTSPMKYRRSHRMDRTRVGCSAPNLVSTLPDS